MKNLITILWPDKSEGNTYGKKVKSWQVMSEEEMRKLTPHELHLRYWARGEQIAGYVHYIKAYKETEARQGFVHAQHPINLIPLK